MAYCLHLYTYLVYGSTLILVLHIISHLNLIICNYSMGEINHMSKMAAIDQEMNGIVKDVYAVVNKLKECRITLLW